MMTTTTFLTGAEIAYMQAALRCMMAVEAEACATVPSSQSMWCELTHIDACLQGRSTGITSLGHQDAAALMCLLGDAADVEVHVPAGSLEDEFEEAAIAATNRREWPLSPADLADLAIGDSLKA